MTHQRWRSIVATCLTAGVVTSCGAHPSAAPAPTPAAPTSATSSGAVPVSDADRRACVGVEAVLAHITVDTAHWSPTLHPFDRDIAVRLASQSRELDSQALGADLRVRRAVAATSVAFGGVAQAIMARERDRLDRAVAASRRAYSGLKVVCRFHG